ncbi:DUF4232 domain-containing protein [Streptomyces sp. SID13726]|uniref:DUF4232 domain-containing protein n=1 Tax=Streptomyces sp. SID13726 TaxID=2706058 RepID=UPI0013B91776|nr:DUF4232 domain-containing protein [Streptomyces sp. SID13726]NEB05977.1 DUF4232 domain-containing protein [Streptomyces sp. SID13726]
MRRPLMSVVAVLLLTGAAACSSSSSSDAEGGSGRTTGSASASSSGDTSASSSGATAAGGFETDGSQDGEVSGGASDNGGSSTTGGTDGGSGSGTSSSSPGVLFGAGDLPTPAADRCRTKNLTAKAVGTGTGRATVVLTNKGSGSCTVRGFPSLLFLGESGRVELPVTWDGSADDAAKVTLAPGASASAVLTFTSLDECDPISGLDVVPPGESRPLTPAFTSGGEKRAVHICDTGVKVTEFARA